MNLLFKITQECRKDYYMFLPLKQTTLTGNNKVLYDILECLNINYNVYYYC